MRRSGTTASRSQVDTAEVPHLRTGGSRHGREPVPGGKWRGAARDRDRSLVVASNRLPVQLDDQGKQKPADGGLIRALEPLCDRVDIWAGTWPDTAPPPQWSQSGASLHAARIGTELTGGYYAGYANRSLWPWLHEGQPRMEHDSRWWSAYQQVNFLFARALALASARRALVWVHDYHLMLVPRALREVRPDLRIGFFLHTPFPRLLTSCPKARSGPLLRGLLGADVIGLQTQADVGRFGRQLLPGISAPGERATGRGWGIPRLVAVLASIDTARLKALATDSRTWARAVALRAQTGGRRIALVDRLDRKAIPSRLDAHEWLLDVGLVDPGDVDPGGGTTWSASLSPLASASP